jgi:uncharacterized protein
MSEPESNTILQRYVTVGINSELVWLFAAITMALSLTVLLILPGLTGPVIVVFIPTAVAIVLIRVKAGRGQVSSLLFTRRAWRVSLSWAVISLGLALLLRLGVSAVGSVVISDYEFHPGAFTPLLLGIFVFAAGEEIGWRGFALPLLLARGYSPLTATMLLGVPWALLHLPLARAGSLNEGWSMWALFLFMLAMSVLVSWVYLASGFSIISAVLFHGGQNVLAVLNDGIDPLRGGWVMVGVYGLAAVLVVLATKGRLGMPPEEHPTPHPGASQPVRPPQRRRSTTSISEEFGPSAKHRPV